MFYYLMQDSDTTKDFSQVPVGVLRVMTDETTRATQHCNHARRKHGWDSCNFSTTLSSVRLNICAPRFGLPQRYEEHIWVYPEDVVELRTTIDQPKTLNIKKCFSDVNVVARVSYTGCLDGGQKFNQTLLNMPSILFLLY